MKLDWDTETSSRSSGKGTIANDDESDQRVPCIRSIGYDAMRSENGRSLKRR